MQEISLSTTVNKHFLDKLLRLAETSGVEATADVLDAHGVKVLARGRRITGEHFEALSGRKLKKTIESSLRVEDPVDTGLIVRTATRIIDTSMPINRILNATGGGLAPLEQLAAMRFDDPMRMLLTLAANDGVQALEHAVSVSLLSLCMARKLQLSDDEQRAAGLAGLLHDIGELYVDPAYLAPGKRLLPHEWAHLVVHPRLGQMLIKELASYPQAVGRAVAEHHERFDGTGYPRQAPGRRISAAGQAVSVAEMISGLLGKDNPLERAELALKIVPGEHPRELLAAVSCALRLQSRRHPGACDDSGGREQPQRLSQRTCAAIDKAQDLIDGSGARSPHARELLGRVLERIITIQRAFISTGLATDGKLNYGLGHLVNDAPDGTLLFEKTVATREIQWRLRDIARDLALHTAGSPDEKSLFAGLIDLLDDDSDKTLAYTPKEMPAPKLASLSPTSFAGSQAYAS